MTFYFYFSMVIAIGGLVVAYRLARWVLALGTGTKEMRVISDAIKEGAEAFLKRQYTTITIISVVLAIILYIFYQKSGKGSELALKTVIAFIFGALCSAIAGFMGMFISIRSNIRTAAAATTSLNTALQAALRGGA